MASLPRPTPLVCDVRALRHPHLGTVGGLARLQLAARRCGRELRLRNAPRELVELLALAGLADALPVELGGEPEERKEPLGVEEEGELGDSAGA